MTKPVIVTRATKGSALTWTEGDTNLENLRDATITIAGDSGSAQALDLNDTLTISGGTGLSSAMTTDTVTLNLDNTAVTPAQYAGRFTVDQQGRITAADNTLDGTNAPGFKNIPAVGTKTTSYSLATGDVGKYVQVGSGGSITIPNSTFAEGDAIVIVNNHSAAITITCTISDAYIAGTDTDKATVSLATRGVANIFFVSATRCIITGNVS
jgi:hypothetical protein